MKKNIIALVIITICKYGVAQLNVGIGGNLSLISISKLQSVSYKRYKDYHLPGGNIEAGYRYKVNDNFNLYSALGLTLLRSKNYFEIDLLTIDGLVGIGKTSTIRNIYYLYLPLYAGINVKHFCFNLGGQFMYALQDSESESVEIVFYGKAPQKYTNTGKNQLNIKNGDFGMLIGVSYQFGKVNVGCFYYHGVINILNTSSIPNWIWKNSQFSLSIKYSFMNLFKVGE